MFVIILIGIISSLVLYYVFEQCKSREFRIMMKNIPKMKGWPLIGSALEFGNNSVEYFETMIRITNTLGPILQLWLGSTPYVLITDAKDIEVILGSTVHLQKSSVYTYLQDWLGQGLLTSLASNWKNHRRILTPAFHFKILESYIDIFNVNTNIMMKLLEKEVGKEKIDIGPYIDKCTLDVICETALATSVNAQLNEESELPKSLKVVSSAILERGHKPWLFPGFMFKLSSLGRRCHKHIAYVNSYIDNVIIKKKEALERKKKSVNCLSENDQTSDDGIYNSKNRKVFIDLLLSYAEDPANQLTDSDIRDEVNTFLFAGHDTTTSAISFAIYMMGKHPEIQEKVLEEVNNVFGETDKDPKYSDLMNLGYLEQVIRETLRLYPSVPYIGRTLLQDLTLPSGHTLPAGVEVVMVIYQLHRDPEVFPNPEQFNPDNFLPEKMAGRIPFQHIPFSAGPRNCIGQKFAVLEMKATLAKLIKTYKITSVSPEPLLASELVLRSATGINVRLEKRH